MQMGRVVGGLFITVDRPSKTVFEVNMYPVFQDSDGVDRILMFSMYKKKFNTTDVDEIKEAFNDVVKSASGQNIRDLIQVTRFGNTEICVMKDIMSYEVMYNGSLYLTLTSQLEKNYSVCYFATRKAPKYIEVKELRYILGSSSLLFFFLNWITTIYYISNKEDTNMKSIDQFRGEYFFLSNFYEAPIYYNGLLYHNNESAFQAQKVLDITIQEQFTNYAPRVAKSRGKKVQLREDWEDVKYNIMRDICLQKFIQNSDIRQRLIDTGDAMLIEGNTWNDTTWGVSLRTGNGKNWLGIILMDVRTIMKNMNDIITLGNK